ncbi:hypothetical protein ACIBO5_07885 [Nonomuraea angiospora]|uniref:hypothetical protein n=1 Tax=Nonomuraea angiospora TaxID=46172 RepID=UPI0037A62945
MLCGGAYGSPGVLLQGSARPTSCAAGSARPTSCAAFGVRPCLDLPGVGRNLPDHPTLDLRFAAGDELARQLTAHGRLRPVPDEQVIGKTRSTGGHALYDLPPSSRRPPAPTTTGPACSPPPASPRVPRPPSGCPPPAQRQTRH